MNYFVKKANKALDLLNEDKKEAFKIAKELRKELALEYNNNDLIRIQKTYSNHELFSSFYAPAVRDAYVKTTGVLSYDNLDDFLYDVQDYMEYYTSQRYKD